MPTRSQEFLVRAGLDDLPAIHDVDSVRMHGRGETMGDHERGVAFSQNSESAQPFDLRPGIHGARRLVQHQQGGVVQEGPGQGDTLPFTDAQLLPRRTICPGLYRTRV